MQFLIPYLYSITIEPDKIMESTAMAIKLALYFINSAISFDFYVYNCLPFTYVLVKLHMTAKAVLDKIIHKLCEYRLKR